MVGTTSTPQGACSLKSQVIRKERDSQHWFPYQGDFRVDPPTHTNKLVQAYSNDLVISQSNHASLLGKVRENLGGNFQVIKRHYVESSTLPNGAVDFNEYPGDPRGGPYDQGHWTTPVFAYASSFGNSMFPSITGSSAEAMDRYGTEAIALVAPTKPEFDSATAIGEFMGEGIPSFTGLKDLEARSSTAKRAGSAYLNEEFGWAPLVNDVMNLTQTISNASQLWDEYKKNSGRLLHRNHSWPTTTDEDVIDFGLDWPVPRFDLNFYAGDGRGHLRCKRTKTVKRWFEGVFQYFVPEGNGISEGRSYAKKLFGADLTPETLWNLAPWSWAADWVGNVGNVLAASSALGTDRLVMPWAFVMETTTESHAFTLSDCSFESYPGSHTLRQTFTTTVKQRQKATPYGFGFDLETLTPRQIAILVALGLSKGR